MATNPNPDDHVTTEKPTPGQDVPLDHDIVKPAPATFDTEPANPNIPAVVNPNPTTPAPTAPAPTPAPTAPAP